MPVGSVRACASFGFFAVFAAGVMAQPPGWSVRVDPPILPATLPADVSPSHQVMDGDDVVYATTSSPFAMVGGGRGPSGVRRLLDLRDGKVAGQISGGKGFSDKARLSPDGQYLLDEAPGSNSQARGVQVWSFRTGQMVRQFDVSDHPAFVYFMDFVGPDRVVTTISHGSGRFDVWDVKTGAKVLGVAGNSTYTHESAAFSPGRTFLAVGGDPGQVLVYDLTKGTLAGQLSIRAVDGGAQRVKTLRFSPDGSELAALLDAGRSSRLVCWGMAKGDVVVDHTFAGDPKHMAPGAFSYKGPAVEWLPDGSAWLLHGHVFIDRVGGRPVWMFKTERWFKDCGPRRMIDDDRALIVAGPDGARRLETVVVPWAKIDASLKALNTPDAPALVRPGATVSLAIEVGRVRHGNPRDTKQQLVEVLTSRLDAEGIKVAENRPVVLRVRYSEDAGEQLHEMKGQGPYSPFGQMTPTGRTVQATKANCHLAWETTDKRVKKALWTGNLDYDPKTLIMRDVKEITDGNARGQMFQQLKYSLAGEPIPYFIPRPEVRDVSMLPGVTPLSDAPRRPASRATPKATNRGKAAAPAKKR